MTLVSPVDVSASLVDTHAHLEDPRLSSDLENLLQRARAAHVVQIVAIGTTADDSAVVSEMAQSRPGVFAAVGIHPNHAAEAGDGDWPRIVDLAQKGNARVVAIGETGLDRHWNYTPFDQQQAWFGRHIELAHQLGLPLVIHCRDCECDIIGQLRALGRPVQGVLHSFSGTWDDAQAFLELGLHLSFAGMLTFTNKSLDELRDVAARVPADRILVETDSPYLSPHPYRGRTNQPAFVTLTAQVLARVRGLTFAELAGMTTSNARRLFRLPDDETL